MRNLYNSGWMNGNSGNSEKRAVIRAKLTVLSSLAAIQIELTIVMHWKGSGRRWTGDDSDRGNKSNSGGDDSFIRFPVWSASRVKGVTEKCPGNYGGVQSAIKYIKRQKFICTRWRERNDRCR